MPWSKQDVESHKKGLSDKQKEQWVHIANSALQSCIAKGGTDETCAASAIRQANGVVDNESKTVIVLTQQSAKYMTKQRIYQGREHLIVPVVMMVEGVHHGSHGPLLHEITELGKIPQSWNGRPVVINHPEVDGVNVSANDPLIAENQVVGTVYNTRVEGNKLMAEAWLDSLKLQEISLEAFNHIKNGEPLEVSLGMFTEDDFTEGEWNGEHYDAIARNHRPDHLALLPGSVGACSMADGCGIRANSDHSDKEDDPKPMFNINKKEVQEMAENAVKCTPCVKKKVDELIANSQGKYTEDDREMLETLNEAILDKMAKPIEVEKVVEKEVTKTVEVNKLTPEDQAALDFGKRQLKERRDGWIQKIQANTKDVWTDEELKTMSDAHLEKLAQSVKKEEVVDYSLNTGFQTNVSTSTVEPLYPAGVEPKK